MRRASDTREAELDEVQPAFVGAARRQRGAALLDAYDPGTDAGQGPPPRAVDRPGPPAAAHGGDGGDGCGRR
ncbi:hypothetical protein [Streptomyces sp. NBC_00078]|uniref:hypothetical protein n=1 Tax=unclassified Streptomyces TaxID=2593676 RepID=UPI00224DCC94|nr:hypothetical protein [Streptomyces sp. NBC_00078]MCX5424523.1 hypothetical protein [Streptomyces sp. NBC_00078]